MNEASVDTNNDSAPDRTWSPLNPAQRRVFGVLIEKAKTTPDAYPLTLNATTTGCNQKSNRAPQTDYDTDDVQETLDSLRQLGAVVEVQGDGRAAKFRHRAYDWLSVDKTEAAVLAELLLRGPQTLGELRSRAARMEAIVDLNALRPIVDALLSKQLMVELSPPGRGQVVTHGLYGEEEMARLQKDAPQSTTTPTRSQTTTNSTSERITSLEAELSTLRDRVEILETRIASWESA